MARHDRLALARTAIEVLVPLLRFNWEYHVAEAGLPSRWTLQWRGPHVRPCRSNLAPTRRRRPVVLAGRLANQEAKGALGQVDAV